MKQGRYTVKVFANWRHATSRAGDLVMVTTHTVASSAEAEVIASAGRDDISKLEVIYHVAPYTVRTVWPGASAREFRI